MAKVVLPGTRIWLYLVGYGITALFCVLAHMLLLPWIAVAGIVPDLLLVLIFWIALRHGQIPGAVAGFGFGLLLDAASQGILGMHAFAKALAGFIVGFFAHPDDPQWLLTADIMSLLGIGALGCGVHNVVYFALFVHPLDVSLVEFVLKYAGAATGYTLVAAAVALFGWRLLQRRSFTAER